MAVLTSCVPSRSQSAANAERADTQSDSTVVKNILCTDDDNDSHILVTPLH